MKFKRIAALIMVGMISVSILAGCGNTAKPANGDTTSKGNSEDKKEGETGDNADSNGPIDVSFTGVAWGNGADKDCPVEQELEKTIGINMDVTWISYEDYTSRVNVAIAAGNSTDVVQILPVEGKVFYPQIADAIDNDQFWDLTPFLEESGFIEKNAVMKNWDSAIWDNCRYKGRIFAIPRRASDPVPNAGILVRKDLMESAGITEEPKTVDELKDFIIEMSEKTGLYGLDFSLDDMEHEKVKQIANAFTGIQDWGIDDKGEFFYQSFMEEYKDFLQWMKDLYDAGAIDPEFTLNQSDNSAFVGGKSAVKMHTWYVWNQSQINEDGLRTPNRYFDESVDINAEVWGMLPVTGPKGTTLALGQGTGFDNPILISKNVPEEEVMKIIEAVCFTGEEYENLMHNGIEGLNYHLDAAGAMDTANKTEEEKAANKANYVGGWNQILLDTNPDFIQDKFVKAGSKEENKARAEEISAISKAAAENMNISCPTLSLQSDTYNTKWTSLTQDLNNNKCLVIMGKMSMEQWDEYIKTITESSDFKAIAEEFKAAKVEADNAK